MQVDDFLTIDEMTKVLKVPKKWIYSRTRETGPNSIPRLRGGKYIRVEKNRVLRWIKEQNEEVKR